VDFTWTDGPRTIRFGRGALADAPALLGEGYALVTTERARASAPAVVARAGSVHLVGEGHVEDLAGGLLGAVDGELVVALGGGRVVDTAKALAAARPGRRAAAIPTTLSAAEMTWVHRQAAGVARGTPYVRPAIVLNDPALSASQPPRALAASAANSLAHAVEAPLTPRASPVPTLAAREAIRLTARAAAGSEEDPGEAARDGLALAALLSGYAIDAAWYGLHHVCAQTLVRAGGAGHGPANAALLPVTAAALRSRSPAALAAHDEAAGRPLEELAVVLRDRAGLDGIRSTGVPRDRLPACARLAATRRELDHTPPRPGEEELLALYDAAW
jgi:alcohol dehydrogenase class IV